VIDQIAKALVASSTPEPIRDGYLRMTLIEPHPARNVTTNGGQTLFSVRPGIKAKLSAAAVIAFQAIARDTDITIPPNVDEFEDYYQQNAAALMTDGVTTKWGINLWGEGPIQTTSRNSLVNNYRVIAGNVAHTEMPQWFLANVAQHLRGIWGPYQPPGTT